MSDSTRQGIIAIVVAAVGVIALLSFFELAGTVGDAIDNWIAKLFGWDRWLFALLLLVISWGFLVPSKNVLRTMSVIGLVLFFLSFNGILNLFMADINSFNTSDLMQTGGYAGLLVSYILVGWTGFWGTLVIAFTLLSIAIMLIFNVSIQSVLAAHTHFSDLGRFLHRESVGGDDDISQDTESDSAEETEEEEKEMPRKRILPDEEDRDELENESVMTSSQRRKMEIPLSLLNEKGTEAKAGDIERSEEIIHRTLQNFGIDVEMAGVKVGPAVTQYSLRPSEGIKLSRIVALQDDLALALAAHPIRIEAPIPGRSLVGIEVPNQKIGMVTLRELLTSKEFKNRKTDFTAPLGKDVSGEVQMVSVDKAPHMLVAGATGSGKSVCLNGIILSLLYQNGPDDLKFIMVDPKRVELGVYKGIPHLLVPPITKVEEAINALKWAVREMERRLDHLAKSGARNIDAYNAKSKERMPKIIIIIDELADLMSQNKRDVEAVIVRIAQMARAVGIHLVLATQRPSVDVITGLIKANIPTRLAFAVASQVDSKTILDQGGAEKLLGRGDMLMTSPQISKPRRQQGALITDKEIEAVIGFLKQQGKPDYNYNVTEDMRTGGTAFNSEDSDDLLEEAIQVVIVSGKASTSFLQRRLKVGYSRAARMIDIMEEMGVVSAADGARAREVLIDEWPAGRKGLGVSQAKPGPASSESRVSSEEDDYENLEHIDDDETDEDVEDVDDFDDDELELEIEEDDEEEYDDEEESEEDEVEDDEEYEDDEKL